MKRKFSYSYEREYGILKLKNMFYYLSAVARNIFKPERDMKVIDWLDINYPGEHKHFIHSITTWHANKFEKEINEILNMTFDDVIEEMKMNKYPRCIGPLDTIVRDKVFDQANLLKLSIDFSEYEVSHIYKHINELNTALKTAGGDDYVWHIDPNDYTTNVRYKAFLTHNDKIVYGPFEFGSTYELGEIIGSFDLGVSSSICAKQLKIAEQSYDRFSNRE